jgi:predicted ester cyclase
MAGFPDWNSTVHDTFAAGDKVAFRLTINGTFSGTIALWNVKPTGKKVSWTVFGICRCAGGKVVEWWEQMDTLGLFQQIGLIPGPA